jgi:hypothetical protein
VDDIVPVDEIYRDEAGQDGRAELDETKEEEELDENPAFS